MNMVSSRGGLVDEIKGGEKNPIKPWWNHHLLTNKTIEFVRRGGDSTIWFEQPTQKCGQKRQQNYNMRSFLTMSGAPCKFQPVKHTPAVEFHVIIASYPPTI
jgi:hypothetical protein